MVSEEATKMLNIGIKALEDKKGENIRVFDISDISIMADIIVIASGNNKNQVQAMCDNTLEMLHKNNYFQRNIEGYDGASWVLIDVNDVIFHVFDKESRAFYDIERLFADAKEL